MELVCRLGQLITVLQRFEQDSTIIKIAKSVWNQIYSQSLRGTAFRLLFWLCSCRTTAEQRKMFPRDFLDAY